MDFEPERSARNLRRCGSSFQNGFRYGRYLSALSYREQKSGLGDSFPHPSVVASPTSLVVHESFSYHTKADNLHTLRCAPTRSCAWHARRASTPAQRTRERSVCAYPGRPGLSGAVRNAWQCHGTRPVNTPTRHERRVGVTTCCRTLLRRIDARTLGCSDLAPTWHERSSLPHHHRASPIASHLNTDRTTSAPHALRLHSSQSTAKRLQLTPAVMHPQRFLPALR